MPNPFDDILPTQQPVAQNPFDDIIPPAEQPPVQQAAGNPFDDIIAEGAPSLVWTPPRGTPDPQLAPRPADVPLPENNAIDEATRQAVRDVAAATLHTAS